MTHRRTLIRLTLGAWLIYLAVLAPSLASWDSGAMLNVAISVIERHEISVPPNFGIPGRGGKYYSMWYPLQSALAIPFAEAGIFVAHHAHLPEMYVASLAAIFLSTIIAAANVAATYWLARVLGVDDRWAALAGAAFGFSTLALRYSRSFYADPLLTLFVTLGLACSLSESASGALLGLCCALAIVSKPPGLLMGIAVLFNAAAKGQWKKALSATAGMGVGSALYLVWNFARFGSIFKFGPPNFWKVSAMPIDFAGLLLSPSSGLLICCPIVLLAIPLWRRGRLIFALTLCLLVFYSAWTVWWSTDWGPRYLMPIVAGLIAVSALTKHKRTWLALAALGLLMQIPTVMGYPERYQDQLREGGVAQGGDTWKPGLSPLVQMWPSSIAQIREAEHENVNNFKTFHVNATRLADARNFRIVPLWWWMLPLVHIPRIVGALVALATTLLGAWFVATAWPADSATVVPETTSFEGKMPR